MGFFESVSSGTIGECIVWNFFTKQKSIRTVVDVRDDSYFQSIDVDFLIENEKRQYSWVEVKTDFKAFTTGNFVYEVSTSGNVGCFEKTKANYIIFYVPQSGLIYICSVRGLREYVYGNSLKMIAMGDHSKGYLLDIGDLERTGVIKGIYQAEKTRGD